jgi:hypothetical protein
MLSLHSLNGNDQQHIIYVDKSEGNKNYTETTVYNESLSLNEWKVESNEQFLTVLYYTTDGNCTKRYTQLRLMWFCPNRLGSCVT